MKHEKYWKMQLHPGDDRNWSIQHACRMLSQNCIGLDSAKLGFNMLEDQAKAERVLGEFNHKNYLLFARKMQKGDFVLVAPRSAPLALCIVASDYIFDEHADAREGIVFRHLRFVRAITFFGDVFNRKDWPKWNLNGQGTIGQIREDTMAHDLIDSWRKKRKQAYGCDS